MKNNFAVSAFVAVALFLVSGLSAQSPHLLPVPTQIVVGDQSLQLPADISLNSPENSAWDRHLQIVAQHVERITDGRHRLVFVPSGNALLDVRKVDSMAKEAYSLVVSAEQIKIEASTLKGLSHATATLLQVLGSAKAGQIPQLKINDSPTVSYRNFMVDMGRNPHSVELLKETIDLLWFYKIDSLQLHLTDDQRFAFPSTAFPKLWDGIITLDQFKELETYATERGVTIIPELEVPGHSGLLRSRYPEVFGKSEADLATSETALRGIKTLLDEMMEVFSSSPWIHVGGDEASGVPEVAQRDLINMLHAYLKSKGRETIVWEGPRPGEGENKVNTEVIHINWRTINYPANEMLDDGYRVVNAGWDPLYLVDHYPRTNFTMTSAQHIYETLKLTRFKHVNPGIPTFAKPIEVEPSDRLIGFCMPWWEGREENYFPQVTPRLIAFADVSWNPDAARDFASYRVRAEKIESARSAAFYPVTIKADGLANQTDGVFHEKTTVELTVSDSYSQEHEIRFTLDGSQPTLSSNVYSSPLLLEKSSTVRAALFDGDAQLGHGSRRHLQAVTPVKNLALGKPVTSSVSSESPFSVQRVTDGGTGNLDFYLAYPAEPQPVEITIDLEQTQTVGRVVVVAYSISGSFEKYSVEVSADGESFEEVASRLEKSAKAELSVEHTFEARDVRFVRIVSHGNKGYVFDSFSKIVEVQVFE
ncbi:family 20 glycosylhydrolase [Mariniblastus fucicola]|uniref:beta-N-acetylhexosaminidase n=1 Tax=Mariniblastus fucicola TaxID=980251 RepID=A0A5B9PB04_9BACT|nr:family 20 glycosylhydrolase [Mariniblastus fucicola]QEG22160.1 Beta-hexosaminidase [Mariniblastus fucicola]